MVSWSLNSMQEIHLMVRLVERWSLFELSLVIACLDVLVYI